MTDAADRHPCHRTLSSARIQEAIGMQAAIRVLLNMEELFNGPVQAKAELSPDFENRSQRVTLPSARQSDRGGDVAKVTLAILEELRRKTYLCGGGTWLGSDGKQTLELTASGFSPWLRLEYGVPFDVNVLEAQAKAKALESAPLP